MAQDDFSVARNARAVEWLKAEMAAGVGNAFRQLIGGKRESVAESLADTIMASYLLGTRVGVSPEDLDARINRRLAANIKDGHQLERWFGDLSDLLEYRKRRERS